MASVFDRVWRCVVVWFAASSLLVSSMAALVHTHEHSEHAPAGCLDTTKPSKTHVGCRHHHKHSTTTTNSESASQRHPTHQVPTLPHSHDDCSLCQFLLEHPLPPNFVELPLLDVVIELRTEATPIFAEFARFDLPPVRGPPGWA